MWCQPVLCYQCVAISDRIGVQVIREICKSVFYTTMEALFTNLI